MISKIALGLFLFLGCINSYSQVASWKKETLQFQKELNEHYSDTSKSPLADAQCMVFKAHHFFPARKKYCVMAKFVRTETESPFEMPTSSGITKTFVRYGVATFQLKGELYQLNIYQNLKLAATEEHKDYLFLPFTDATTGGLTYGGGRYIDLCIPKGDSIVINFNTAYNPYCAYSTGWNCPLVPTENDLPIEVRAGVKGVTMITHSNPR